MLIYVAYIILLELLREQDQR